MDKPPTQKESVFYFLKPEKSNRLLLKRHLPSLSKPPKSGGKFPVRVDLGHTNTGTSSWRSQAAGSTSSENSSLLAARDSSSKVRVEVFWMKNPRRIVLTTIIIIIIIITIPHFTDPYIYLEIKIHKFIYKFIFTHINQFPHQLHTPSVGWESWQVPSPMALESSPDGSAISTSRHNPSETNVRELKIALLLMQEIRLTSWGW